MKAPPNTTVAEDLLPLPRRSIVVELVVIDLLGPCTGLTELLDDVLAPHGAIRRYDNPADMRKGWRERRPDLLVVDASRAEPGDEVDPMAVCAALSKATPESSVPIVLQIDVDDPASRRTAFEAGATDVWVAPIGDAELRTRLRNITSRQAGLDLRWADPADLPPPRVLLADSHDPARKLLAHHLRAEGWEIVAVDDGRHAQQRLKTEAFDLIVLDLDLPHRNGFQILELLRDDVGPSAIAPAVVISSTSQDDHVLRAFRLGAQDFVAKPFSPAVVHARLARCLSRNRPQTQSGR